VLVPIYSSFPGVLPVSRVWVGNAPHLTLGLTGRRRCVFSFWYGARRWRVASTWSFGR